MDIFWIYFSVFATPYSNLRYCGYCIAFVAMHLVCSLIFFYLGQNRQVREQTAFRWYSSGEIKL